MDTIIYAKLHDILKLTGDSRRHFCPELDDDFAKIKPVFKKFLKHHCVSWHWSKKHKEGCSPFGIDPEMLCVHLADVKAATISRKLRTSKYQSYTTFRIWKDKRRLDKELEKDEPTSWAISDILKKLNTASDLNQFYDQYKDNWDERAEDKKGCPFASLDTHNQLTAAWYGFFLYNREYFEIPDLIYNDYERRKAVAKVAGKEIALVRMRLVTNIKLSRLRDSKLIMDSPRILDEVRKDLKGVAIYTLPEEMLFVTLPEDLKSIQEKIESTLGNRTNYYLETSVVPTKLSNRKKEFLNKYNFIFRGYQKNFYPKLDEEISIKQDNEASHRAIICDMCQMAPATTIYPQEIYNDEEGAEPVEEFLCEGCLAVRRDSYRAKNLAAWEDESDAGVAFFKINLDMHALVEMLKKMFLEVFTLPDVIEDDLGFSIIDEFIKDYKQLLTEFREAVFNRGYNESDHHEIILDNLFCIKTKRDGNIGPHINDYVDLISMDKFFSQMVHFAGKHKMRLPFQLSVTVSSIKYPFMEHWQVLNAPKEDLNISLIPHTRLVTNITKYNVLRNSGIEDKKVSSALHNLVEIEERTRNKFLVTVAMLDMKNDLKELAKSLITTNELFIDDTLAYYKITKGSKSELRGEEHE